MIYMKQLLDKSDFEETIKEGSWLVDFSATWCGPCRMLEPNLEEFSKQHGYVLKVCENEEKYDIED